MDIVKAFFIPTLSNIKEVATSGLRLYSIYFNAYGFSALANGISISHTYYAEGYYAALRQASNAVGHIALPYILISISSPHIGTGYGIALKAHTLYKALHKAYDLYESSTSIQGQVKSLHAWVNLVNGLYQLTGINMLDEKAQQWTTALNDIK